MAPVICVDANRIDGKIEYCVRIVDVDTPANSQSFDCLFSKKGNELEPLKKEAEETYKSIIKKEDEVSKDLDKLILLLDLSARLKYRPKCKVTFKDGEGWKTEDMYLEGLFADGQGYFVNETGDSIYSYDYKPYLRRTLTEEEIIARDCIDPPYLHDFYNKRHLDYRHLISLGMALEL